MAAPTTAHAPREHVFDGPCWCRPEERQECPACAGDGCRRCDWSGWVAHYTDDPAVLGLAIHNAEDDPGRRPTPEPPPDGR